MPISTEGSSRVTVEGIPGPWDTHTGGGLTRENSKQRPAAGEPHVAIQGRPMWDDLTVTRHYDPARDADWFHRLHRGERLTTTIVVQDIDPDGVPVPGARKSYAGTLANVTPPDGDANSDEAAKVSLTFTITSVA